jgi:hypothetical protein
VVLGVVDERLGAVAALHEERATLADVGEERAQVLDLVGGHDRRDAGEHASDVLDLGVVLPRGNLLSGQVPPSVELIALGFLRVGDDGY